MLKYMLCTGMWRKIIYPLKSAALQQFRMGIATGGGDYLRLRRQTEEDERREDWPAGITRAGKNRGRRPFWLPVMGFCCLLLLLPLLPLASCHRAYSAAFSAALRRLALT